MARLLGSGAVRRTRQLLQQLLHLVGLVCGEWIGWSLVAGRASPPGAVERLDFLLLTVEDELLACRWIDELYLEVLRDSPDLGKNSLRGRHQVSLTAEAAHVDGPPTASGHPTIEDQPRLLPGCLDICRRLRPWLLL